MKNYLFLIFLVGFISCRENTNNTVKDENNAESATSGIIDVTATILLDQEFQNQIVSNGRVEAQKRGELKFQATGPIKKIYTKNGQIVPKGTLLAELDNELQKNELEKARINFETASNKLNEEKINYGYSSQLNKHLDSVIVKSLQIRTGFLEAKNSMESARILYEQTYLRAPFSGVIANLTDKEGSYPSVTEPFCILVTQQKMDVVFLVLENELHFLKNGQSVSINTFSNKSEKYPGKVTEINPMVDDNGMVRVKARIINPDKMLFDGMNVKVFINNSIEGLVVVPKTALVLRSNREVVFTLTNGRAKWNYVEIVDQNTSNYALKKGLKIGDTIIISNNTNLKHDIEVSARITVDNEKY